MPSDCAIGTLQVDCCGTFTVTGVADSELRAFEAAARECSSRFPGFGCTSRPTYADDGTVMDPVLEKDARVECVDDVCTTTFPQSGQACGESLVCSPALEVCVARAPVGPSIRYSCQPGPAGCEQDRTCACLAASLCIDAFDVCTDTAQNMVGCECPQCQ